jgi:hypothetical protein
MTLFWWKLEESRLMAQYLTSIGQLSFSPLEYSATLAKPVKSLQNPHGCNAAATMAHSHGIEGVGDLIRGTPRCYRIILVLTTI